MKMHDNLAINETTMDCKKSLPRPRSILSTYAKSIISRHISNKGEGSPTRQKVPETDESTVESRRSLLLTLPAEIRNIIYFMVLDDLSRNFQWCCCIPGCGFCLNQPAVARVNRQLRTEILPLFYYHKIFSVRVYPKKHSEVDGAWNSFLNRLAALTVRRDGPSFLSYIQKLEVQLWHPAFEEAPLHLGNTTGLPLSYQSNTDNIFPLDMCNGVLLQFGGAPKPPYVRAGGDDTDWTDRNAVVTALVAGIRANRGGMSFYELYEFKETYPFVRLVDLVMIVAAECKNAAQVICIDTYFAGNDCIYKYGLD